MTPNALSPVGTVAVQGDRATLHFQRRLPHPPAAVWNALTDPKQLSSWYMMQAAVDPRKGGSIDLRNDQFHVTGQILSWDPPRLFEYEWKIRPREGMPNGEDATVRWELAKDGNDTLLTLTHRNLSRQTALGVAPAMHVLLDRLAAKLDGRPMPDMKERFVQVQQHYPPRGA
jgi:uncharacterized protein YndB with AHSA1/START domain